MKLSLLYTPYKIFIIFIVALVICGCDTQPKEPKITTIRGKAFLQPVDKKLSLALAPTTYIIINFIDSVYCDIEYRGYRRLTASRKYSIDSNDIVKFFNPVNDKVRTYKFVNAEDGMFLANEEDTRLYKIISSDSLNYYLGSSSLRKAEFLYPSLDEKERMNGAEDRYVDENGLLKNVRHPMKSEVRKINIYNLF